VAGFLGEQSTDRRVNDIALDGPGADTSTRIDQRRLVVAFVCAHPDDDVMGATGSVYLHRDDPCLRFVLIHATDGAAGEIWPESGATRENLGAVRRAETVAGWRVVGRLPDRHEWLGFDDGTLVDLPIEALADPIAAIFAEERPDVVMTFGPDGITGHPDHIAVGAAATAAFLRFAGDGDIGFRRLLLGAYPQSAFERAQRYRMVKGLEPFDPTKVFHPRGVPDELIAVTQDQRDIAEVIREAFRQHRTQWGSGPFATMSDREWYGSVGRWHAVQAWPPREPGLPRMSDPFEGLD
jgi:LmbE family N-acetylglucosaminyl deacetylase